MIDSVDLLVTTNIDGIEYMALGGGTCLRLSAKDQILYSDNAIKEVLDPLSKENSSPVLEILSDKIKKVGAELLSDSSAVMGTCILDFRADKKYKIFLHKKNDSVIGIALRYVTQEELDKAKREKKPRVDIGEIERKFQQFLNNRTRNLH